MDFSIKAFNTKNAIAEHKSSCIAVGAVSYTHLTLPTIYSV